MLTVKNIYSIPEFNQIPYNPIISWLLSAAHDNSYISQNTTAYEKSQNTTEYHRIPQNTTEYHRILHNTYLCDFFKFLYISHLEVEVATVVFEDGG